MKTKILASTLLTIGLIFAFAAIRPVGVTFATPTAFTPRYTLIDFGTFGGPNSQFNGAPPVMINSAGVAAGAAATSTACSLPDPFSDGFLYPAFKWENGQMINLGVFPGGCWSLPNAINERGMIVGSGDLPVIDPLTGLAEIHANLFYNGQNVDMGTLGGASSLAADINSLGKATGFAENTNPDPYAEFIFPGATSYHGFSMARRSHDRFRNSRRAGLRCVCH